ncbi:MAG: glycosyltransferase family 2 protein [Kiritimatiellae bacterium]|nr:glycosyltransferase family 2 protein [Kiritimatiellia bacterium]MDW8457934.1 glycosyltransferase family 2 protein [Verrucomicrobiota bacterium]
MQSTASAPPAVSVVIPVYNEEENIHLLCEKLHASLSTLDRTYEIILVDDGSTDRTWQLLIENLQKYPNFRAIRFRRNFGQTAAMSAGFHAARGEVIVTLDADLQNDPTDIPKLLERIDAGYDVVSGWRKDRKDAFLNRRLPSMIANALISRITGVALHDYGCTLKAYRSEVIKNVHLYGEMHRFIPALASWVGGRIDEVVVSHHPRRFGKSKYGLSRTFRVVLDLLTVKFLLQYSTRPIHVFGRFGLLCGGIAAVMIAAVAIDRIFVLADPHLLKRPFWIVTPLMMLAFGMQFISMGLLAEMQIRTYHEAQNKPIYVIRETVESRPAA